MKRFVTTVGVLWMTLLAAPYISSAATGREDESGFFTWLFIGLCALIVVLQILPAALRMAGLARETKVHEPAPERHEN